MRVACIITNLLTYLLTIKHVIVDVLLLHAKTLPAAF